MYIIHWQSLFDTPRVLTPRSLYQSFTELCFFSRRVLLFDTPFVSFAPGRCYYLAPLRLIMAMNDQWPMNAGLLRLNTRMVARFVETGASAGMSGKSFNF